jgi:hypothetical protein
VTPFARARPSCDEMEKERSEVKWLGGSVAGGCILVLLASFADPAVVQFREFAWTSSNLLFAGACLLPVAAFTLAALVLILRATDDRAVTRLVLLVLLCSLIARVAWVHTFDSYQTNDFGAYLNCAGDVAATGDPSRSENCSSTGFVYWKRAAAYTYPIVLVFGTSLAAVQAVNTALVTLTGWFFYLGGRRIFGARIAAVALLLFIWHPDLWFAMTLASHDVPGMLWLSVFFYLAVRLRQRLLDSPSAHLGNAALSLATGAVVFMLGITRSYQDGAIAALGACAAIHAACLLFSRDAPGNAIVRSITSPRGAGLRQRVRAACVHVALLALVPTLVYLGTTDAFAAATTGPSAAENGSGGTTCYVSSMNVLGTNRYDEIENWMEQCPSVPEADRAGFAARKVLHEMTNSPGRFLRHLVEKNRVLSRADDYLFWAAETETGPGPAARTAGQVGRVNGARLSEQAMALYIAHVAFLLLVAWRLLLFPSSRFRMDETIPIAFSAVYYGMFLVFLESQARYEIFLVFVFSWMAGQGVVDIAGRLRARTQPRVPAPFGRRAVYAGGALAVAAAVGAYWGTASLIADSSLTLRDQAGFTADVPAGEAGVPAGPRVGPLFVANDHKELIVAYPGGSAIEAGSVLAVRRRFDVHPANRHRLQFFLSTAAVRQWPFDSKKHWDDQEIEYLVLANGFPVAAGDIGDIDGNRFVSVSSGQGPNFGRQLTLQLILRNRSRIERVAPERGPLLALEYVDLR